MRTVALGEICDLVVGKTPPRADIANWGGNHPWVTIRDLSRGDWITETTESLSDAGASRGKLVAPGTVLMSFKLSLGKVARAARPLFTNEAIVALPVRPDAEVDEQYLAHSLRALDLEHIANRAAKGKTLNRETLSNLQLSLPPLEEQRRIAGILDRADALVAKRRKAIEHLDALGQSIFFSLVAGRGSRVMLCDVAKTSSGGTPARQEVGNFGGSIPWVKSGELSQGTVRRTEEFLTEKGLKNSSARLLPAGTVLMAMYGATAGSCAKLGIEAATNQAVCAFECSDQLMPEFLLPLLRSKLAEILRRTVGGAQPNLSQGTIRALELDLPSLSLQRDVVQRIRRVTANREMAQASLEQTEQLATTLAGYFFRP